MGTRLHGGLTAIAVHRVHHYLSRHNLFIDSHINYIHTLWPSRGGDG